MSAVYVQQTNTGEWGVFGGNLPTSIAWALYEEQADAEAEALEIAEDIGVGYEGVLS